MAQPNYNDQPPAYSPYASDDMNTPLIQHTQQQPKGYIPPPPVAVPNPYMPYPAAGPPPIYQTYGSTTYAPITVAPTTEVVIIGGCPICKSGIVEDEYTACGILCCILFFPLGVLCCLAMQQKCCSNCGATF